MAKKSRKSQTLSEAKNFGNCKINELRRSFRRFTQDRVWLLRMTVERFSSIQPNRVIRLPERV